MKRTFEQHSVNKFGKVSLESKSNSPGWPPCKFSNRPTSVAYCRHVWLSPRMPNLNMACLSQTFRWSTGSLQSRACPQPVDSCSHVSGGCYQSGKEFMQLLCTTPLLRLSAKYVVLNHFSLFSCPKQADATVQNKLFLLLRLANAASPSVKFALESTAVGVRRCHTCTSTSSFTAVEDAGDPSQDCPAYIL